jgi:hypothetical protein
MTKITSQKVQKSGLQNLVDVLTCDIRAIDQFGFPSDFDLVFSDFGGLNCLDGAELKTLSVEASKLLKPGGRFIAVVMPRYCLWESFYFLSKFDFKNMFRRNREDSLQVKLGGGFVETWYYSPAQFNRLFQIYFKKIAIKPIGIAIPPSYMENTIGRNQNLLTSLNSIEDFLGSMAFLSLVSDHFLVDMIKKERK